MRNMSYPGICQKYGSSKALAAGYFGPTIPAMALMAMQGATSSAVFTAMSISVVGGAFGFCAATITHGIADKVLRRKKVGLKRGGELVRKFQIAAYSIPAATLLAYGTMATPGADEQSIQSEQTDLTVKGQQIRASSP